MDTDCAMGVPGVPGTDCVAMGVPGKLAAAAAAAAARPSGKGCLRGRPRLLSLLLRTVTSGTVSFLGCQRLPWYRLASLGALCGAGRLIWFRVEPVNFIFDSALEPSGDCASCSSVVGVAGAPPPPAAEHTEQSKQTGAGQYCVSGGSDAGVHLWNPYTGKLIKSYQVSARAVLALALTADSSKMATGGEDSTPFLWDIATGAQLRKFRGHLSVCSHHTTHHITQREHRACDARFCLYSV